MRAISASAAKKLGYRDEIYDRLNRNADGSPARWRVNDKVQVWKTQPDRFRVPLKHGLYDYSELTQSNKNRFSLKPK